MILFESPLIRLEYAPATDILSADLSAAYEFYLMEVREAFDTLVKTVRHYDVKKVLMDSRNRIIQVEQEKYAALLTNFLDELQATRLQKLARLHTGNSTRENLVKTMQQQIDYSFQIKTFTDKDQALKWLKEV